MSYVGQCVAHYFARRLDQVILQLVCEVLDTLHCGHLHTRGGGTPHMKGVGMLVVSLRGVNFGFWSHLGCSEQNAIIFSREGLV